MRDQSPLDQVERALACLVVLPNDEQFLAWRSIVATRHISQPAVADIKALDNGEAQRLRALNNTTTHRAKVSGNNQSNFNLQWGLRSGPHA